MSDSKTNEQPLPASMTSDLKAQSQGQTDCGSSDCYTELDQIWSNEPGSYLRVVKLESNGAIKLELRTGPQGSTSASTCRASLELTNYRAKRLADVILQSV